MDLSGTVLVALCIGLALAFLVFFYFIPIGLWISALFSGVKVSLFTLVGMK